jgi:hypothetical protein
MTGSRNLLIPLLILAGMSQVGGAPTIRRNFGCGVASVPYQYLSVITVSIVV